MTFDVASLPACQCCPRDRALGVIADSALDAVQQSIHRFWIPEGPHTLPLEAKGREDGLVSSFVVWVDRAAGTGVLREPDGTEWVYAC